jgi:hypothetical protein
MTLVQIIVKLVIWVPIIITLLVFLLVYRNHFGIGKNPMEYIEILLDCYSIFEIYACVGFFILQLVKDCKMRRNKKLMYRYYNYTLIKIINKMEKYFTKIKHLYNELNAYVMSFDINNRDEYYNYLNNTFKDIKEKMNTYGINGNFVSINNNVGINNFNQNAFQLTTNDQFRVSEKSNQRTETIKIEEDFPTSIRKYKKSIRRINKLKKLYKEILIEKNNLILNIPKKCEKAFYLLFVPFVVVILNDFLLPFVLDSSETTKKRKKNMKKKKAILALLFLLLVRFLL